MKALIFVLSFLPAAAFAEGTCPLSSKPTHFGEKNVCVTQVVGPESLSGDIKVEPVNQKFAILTMKDGTKYLDATSFLALRITAQYGQYCWIDGMALQLTNGPDRPVNPQDSIETVEFVSLNKAAADGSVDVGDHACADGNDGLISAVLKVTSPYLDVNKPRHFTYIIKSWVGVPPNNLATEQSTFVNVTLDFNKGWSYSVFTKLKSAN